MEEILSIEFITSVFESEKCFFLISRERLKHNNALLNSLFLLWQVPKL